MNTEIRTITIDPERVLLSGRRRLFKSEGFIALTKKIMSIDAFLSRVAEGIFYEGIFCGADCYTAETEDRQYTLFFCGRGGGDLVFYKFVSATESEGGVDRTLSEYLGRRREIKMTVKPTADRVRQEDLTRIYLVSGGDGFVNFPLLNDTQRRIVETEDSNMLVQGVAGSGKTNVCVEKIVYCACRGYRGKVLYTTFSRGLLSETQNRVALFLRNIEDFLAAYEAGKVVFLDDRHRSAVENKLGIPFDTDDDGKMILSLKRIAAFLREQVDYFLIEDIYGEHFPKKQIAGESDFLNGYLKNNRLAGAVQKSSLAPEILYKEIYGMIFGKYELSAPSPMMGREEYFTARSESFTRAECELIYTLATDYAAYLKKNDLTDNNFMSRALLEKITSPVYSVGVVDEAQDFTQVNLCLIKRLCRKLFCVGDALQMINPSYFNFGYLKRLMYGDVTGIRELRHNYRSTEKIERISEKLSELNMRRFGTHSFVLKGESVPSLVSSSAVFVRDKNFAARLTARQFESITLVVATQRKKEELRRLLKKTEILTVAEAKGLERNTVVLLNVLSDNLDRWNYLNALSINRKTADENSVFRYYFNLFYVGVSRARQYLFVAEENYPALFSELFHTCFEEKSVQDALAALTDAAGKVELDDEELTDRIEKFCALEQYENARFAADRLSSEALREKRLAEIFVHEHFLRFNDFRSAGVEYWRRGMDREAREMFTRSGDEALFPLMDACKRGGGALDLGIVRFYPLVKENDVAKKLILETLKSDLGAAKARQKNLKGAFKRK